MKKLLWTIALTLLTPALHSAASNPSDQLLREIQRGNEKKVIGLLNQVSNINIKYPADPRSQRLHSGGNTPLHEALKKLREKGGQNYVDIARALIDNKNIDASITNDAQATPLHMLAGFVSAQNPNYPQAEKKGIVQNNNETSRTDLAAIADELIRRRKPNLDAKDESGRTPLHWAAIQGFPELVGILIARGATVDARDNQGRTPLMKAAQKGYLKIMQQLIDAGANVNLQDGNKGRTALHWIQRMREGATVKGGNQMTKEHALQAVDLLLKAGANPTLKDKVTEDNPIARSAIDWAQLKSPWSGENKELNLLMTSPHAQQQPSTASAQSSTSCAVQ